MRPLEMLVLIALLPVVGGFLLRPSKRPAWLQLFSWLSLILMVAHLLAEKYRWQMVPAYLLIVLLFALGLRKVDDNDTRVSGWRTMGRIAGVMLGFLVLAATAFLALKLPVFDDPATTGPFAVGTTQLYFVDASREDTFAPKPHTPRELLVVVWYPAEVTAGAQPQPSYPDVTAWGPQMANQFHVVTGLPVPSFMNAHWGLVKSHSYLDMPVANAQAQYPVLIFSHGYGAWIRQNTPQMEELASHGFVVFSIGHPYESAAIAFPDGHVVPYSPSRYLALMKPAQSDPLTKLEEQMRIETNSGEIRQVLAKMSQVGYVQESLAAWVADTRYLMDELAKVNAGADKANGAAKRFANRLDLGRLGVFGMSFGGATAGVACLKDPRCKAGLNMD